MFGTIGTDEMIANPEITGTRVGKTKKSINARNQTLIATKIVFVRSSMIYEAAKTVETVFGGCLTASTGLKPGVNETAFEAHTPKALANWSPGLERSDNPGIEHKEHHEP